MHNQGRQTERSRQRVTLVLGTLAMGGAERQALLLGEALTARGNTDVSVLGMSRAGVMADRCDVLGFAWVISRFRWPCRFLSLLRDLPRLAWRLRRQRPDVIIGYTSWANVGCGLVWRLTGARCFIWNQRSVLPQGIVGSRLARFAAWLSSGWTANSTHAADFLANAVGVDRARIHVIYNAVALPPPVADPETWRKQFGVSKGQPVVTMVANLREPKDHATLIDAWARLIQQLNEAATRPVLVLAGRQDELYSTLLAQTKCLGIEKTIRFAGEVQDVTGLLKASDIGVFCSKSEGLPNGVLESMACGLPLVGSDLPGIREALGPESPATLVPVGDAIALCEALRTLLNSPEQRQAEGRIHNARALSVFSLESLVSRTEALINDGMDIPVSRRAVAGHKKGSR